MQVLPYFVILVSLFMLLVLLLDLIGLIIRFVPYLVIPHWIYLGFLLIRVCYEGNSLVSLGLFGIGILLILIALINIIIITSHCYSLKKVKTKSNLSKRIVSNSRNLNYS